MLHDDYTETIVDRLDKDCMTINGVLEKFGYEQAFPVRKGNDTWSVEERVRITHVLLQLLNSKLKEDDNRREAEARIAKLYDEIKSLQNRLEAAETREEASERRAHDIHNQSLQLQEAYDLLHRKSATLGQELSKVQNQLNVNKKQHLNALRRGELERDAIRKQLDEALKDGAIGRADGMFSRLPHVDGLVQDENTNNTEKEDQVDALLQENGEFRALLAGVHMRIHPGSDAQIYELPGDLLIPTLKNDFDTFFDGPEQ